MYGLHEVSAIQAQRDRGLPSPPADLVNVPQWIVSAEWHWSVWPGEWVLHLEAEGGEVAYDRMKEIAELFGTTSLNLVSETRESGGCSTCNFEYEIAIVQVRGVTRLPES